MAGALDVGRELARRMRRLLIDWDVELERRSRRDLRLLLPFGGERLPEELESRLLLELPFRRDSVIVLAPETVGLEDWPNGYLDNTLTAFIDLPFEILWERMPDDPRARDYYAATSFEQAQLHWVSLRQRYSECHLHLTGAANPQRQARVVLHSFYT